MEYAECQTCHADLSILSSMVLEYTSKRLSLINVDFNIIGYLLIRHSEIVEDAEIFQMLYGEKIRQDLLLGE